MHRVVFLQSVTTSASAADSHQQAIQDELANGGYSLAEYNVNDGTNENGGATLGVNADFTSATDANNFHDWLKQYVSDNSGDFQEAETRVHDCNHTKDSDPNKRCPIGDVWRL